jgi:hypothetical protein
VALLRNRADIRYLNCRIEQRDWSEG